MAVIYDYMLRKLRSSDAASPSFTGIVNFAAATELTIAAGVVVITQSVHKIDTEADAATDDLDTITGGANGDMLRLYRAAAGREVVLTTGVGNIVVSTGAETIIPAGGWVDLIHDGTNWRVQMPDVM